MPTAEITPQTTPVIVIAGPTASGKSGLALALAERLDGIIINADPMQVYREIPILAAAPSAEDCAKVPHRLYGIYDAATRGNVVDWLELCKKEIADTRKQQKTPIVVGGTGMYLEALIKGVTPVPETPAAVRKQIAAIEQEQGLAALYELVAQHDPQTANRLSQNDTTRIRRATEIWLHTGKPLSYWHTVPLINTFSPHEFFCIRIKPPRDILDSRIRLRFDLMMQQGALNEAKVLITRNLPDLLPAMRALGVQELKAFINGACTLEEAVEQAKLHSRQYAKRQETWFNNRFEPDACLNGCFCKDSADAKIFVNETVDNLKKRYKILAK